MSRPFAGTQLIVASHNKGKVQELTELLSPFHVEVVAAGALGLPEPAETGATFADNAACKALKAAAAAGLPALADDSGLAVTALGGAPGLYSARWARAAQGFATAMARVNTALGDTNDRSARFTCALALAWPDGHTEIFEGVVEGSIVWPPRGSNGFGYDPIFQPSGHTVTFAEMDPRGKHALSHRVRAFRKLVAACFPS
ncbi:Nucleoside 5-triphosphatase RdgB (dHAPTP, dITP, XTP-specific) [invertebrate metagenome]|uniref:dITP/XTP pyrophosphatase n=1 Tax=invertebrate metagenome TaxID=1711999 RepID=A0A484H6P2_9ZZZZ